MTESKQLVRLLFVCTANATRSQMAEGWCRALKGEQIDVYSAGVQPVNRISSRALRVMQEVGIDLSSHWSKGMDAWPGLEFDYVVVLCDYAHELCPEFSASTRVIHHPVPDPSGIMGPDEQVMLAFRKVREMLRLFVMGMPESLEALAEE